ncbi:unnamed protein product [Diamesa hyperborea]
MKYLVVCILLAFIATVSSLNETSSRVANGIPSYSNDFVYLEVRFIEISRICGGCLITKQWVATTGSCVTDPTERNATNVYAMLGNTYLVKSDTPTVILIIVHPSFDYRSASSSFDFAMLKLSSSIENTQQISVVGTLETNMDYNFQGKTLYVCGYGYIDNKKTKPTYLTCGALTNIKQDTDCGINAGEKNELCFSSTANSGGPCGRDNGAPIYRVNTDYSRVLVGLFTRIVGSNSKSMCIDGRAKYIFTKIAYYDKFITDTIAQNLNN